MGMGLWFGSLVFPLFAQIPGDIDTSHLPLFEWDKVFRLPDQAPLSIPFDYDSFENVEQLSFSWKLDRAFQDSLYLHFLGISWVADLYLNDKYLASFQKPFESRYIALAPGWLKVGENFFVLHIRQKGYFQNFPEAFTGILHPIRVFGKKPQEIRPTRNPIGSHLDSLWVWAPYFRDHGYRYTDSIACRDLFHILNSSVRTVYFPFPPPPRLLELVKKWELERVDTLPNSAYLAMLNPFPYEKMSFSLPQKFWLDAEGNRNPNYGQFIEWHFQQIQPDPLSPGLGIVAILMFSVLALIIVKFANPSFYFAIQRMFSQPIKYIDSLQEASSGNSGFYLMVMIINIISYSILVFLAVYYIQRSQTWDSMSFFRENSLLKQVFYPVRLIPALFVRSFIVVGIAFLLKYFFLRLIGGIFSIRNLSSGMLNLDVICNFPYIQVLTIPIMLILINPAMRDFYGGLFILLGLIYFIRKIYTYFYSLERLFDFSLGVKILYICAFNILPYIIWF